MQMDFGFAPNTGNTYDKIPQMEMLSLKKELKLGPTLVSTELQWVQLLFIEELNLTI